MSPKNEHDDLGSSQANPQQTPLLSAKLYRFAFAKILVIVLSALLLAGAFLSIANDMYAFVKPEKEVAIAVDSPLPLSELASRLEQAGVVSNPFVFCVYVKSKNKTDRLEAFSGQLSLNTAMSYREILAIFSSDTSLQKNE